MLKKEKEKTENTERLTEYNYEEFFNEKVRPLLKELKKVCMTHEKGIPFAFTCAVSNNQKKTTYVNDGFWTGSAGIRLKTDTLTQVILAMNGGKFIPPKEALLKEGFREEQERLLNSIQIHNDENGNADTPIDFDMDGISPDDIEFGNNKLCTLKELDNFDNGIEYVGEL